MFEKISKEKFKKIILFKYTFQLILIHFILGTIVSLIIFVEEAIQSFFVEEPTYLLGYAISLFGAGLANILSVIPYCKLIADCIKGGEEERIIIVGSWWYNYELQTLRGSKRFMCDMFSRKKNVELLLYDQNKNKYRFYWNENYGGGFDEKKLTEKRLKIRYFKRFKIIFSCEQVD